VDSALVNLRMQNTGWCKSTVCVRSAGGSFVGD
jgi:hypothetical protein